MKVLIIKTSSMGDVIHTLPALTDAQKVYPDIQFDWVVEEAFAEIPAWHPAVKRVIPVALRRWRKHPWQSLKSGEWPTFLRQLRTQKYDYVIDAQGLLKSALISALSRGLRCGLDKASAREPLASVVYNRRFAIAREQHAVKRLRQLFAQILGYAVPDGHDDLDYGIHLASQIMQAENSPFCKVGSLTQARQGDFLIFLHGTTWDTKLWPQAYWIQLAKLANQAGCEVQIPWGNTQEKQRAEEIAAAASQVTVLPQLKLTELAVLFQKAKAIVAVDTGLGHLAAALGVPTISLYGPTDASFIGTLGKNQTHLSVNFVCAPCKQKICTFVNEENDETEVKPVCFKTLIPARVWEVLIDVVRKNAVCSGYKT